MPKKSIVSDAVFLTHQPCAECGSSDGAALYNDGHTYCFVCEAYTHGETSSVQDEEEEVTTTLLRTPTLLEGQVKPLPSRGIREDVVEKYDYRIGKMNGQNVHIAPYYDETGRLVAQKIRTKDKQFRWVGDHKAALPFGSKLAMGYDGPIVLTEGEIDALSAYQAMSLRVPVLSIASGAGGQIEKYIAKHREYFLRFREVIIMFDMDDVGRDAAKTAARIIGASAKIAELPHKDANEALVCGDAESIVRARWAAKPYKPEGIVDLASLTERVLVGPKKGHPWPWDTLTQATFGWRTGEVYTIGAGTGVGKTQVCLQVAEHVAAQGLPVGVFFLEQDVAETGLRLAGIVGGKAFHVPDGSWKQEELELAWGELQARGNIHLFDSFGKTEWDGIRENIRYLAHANGVKFIVLDHLTALAAAAQDERRELEQIMAELAGVAKELDIAILLVSHLATPDGTPHEEGGRVMIRHFKGSRAIGYWSYFMFGLERNQQAEGTAERLMTVFRVLKDRFTGRATGTTFTLTMDEDEHRLVECVGAQSFPIEETEEPATETEDTDF